MLLYNSKATLLLSIAPVEVPPTYSLSQQQFPLALADEQMSKRIFVIMEVPMSMSSAWCLRAMLLFSTLALLSLFHAHRFVVLQMPRDNNLTVESLLTNNFKNKNNKQPTLVDRIYYINMNVSRGRRQAMEQWLGNRTMNTIPFQRVEGQMGDGSKGICDLGKKQDPKRCAGEPQKHASCRDFQQLCVLVTCHAIHLSRLLSRSTIYYYS
jgi:hypothetical protein